MSDLAIRVEGLGKQYRIGALQKNGGQAGYKSLRDSIATAASLPFRAAGRLFGRGERNGSAATEAFWALKDVSFEVKRGDIVGVIGRNGAGKSTLLKVLSRITEPTTGRVEIHGRVGSLLEVGTGFHPELSGRDNVFLNGAILGMKRAEIARQFDEIVAFAEVEKFIDTPVKHYSSGMYLRLAFAVAAHLDPEVLVVDEVLAVGDADFQKKCLGKMQNVSESGRTVLFVSHNMFAVQKLCTRAILLKDGQIACFGSVDSVIARHISGGVAALYFKKEAGDLPQILSAQVLTQHPRTDSDLAIMIEWLLPQDIPGIKVGVGLNTPDGQRVFDSGPEDYGMQSPFKRGRYRGVLTVPANTLMARRYGVSVGLWKGSSHSTVYDHQNPALDLSVEAIPSGPYSHQDTRDGLVNVACDWTLSSQKERSIESLQA